MRRLALPDINHLLRRAPTMKQVRERYLFMDQVGTTVSSYLTYEERVNKLAKLGAKGLGDWCTIYIVEEQEPKCVAKAKNPRIKNSHPPLSLKELNQVMRTRRQKQSRHENYHMLITPLVSRGQNLGAIVLTSWAHKPYSPDDLQFIRHFSHRAALAIDNAKLYSQMEQELNKRKLAEEELRRSEHQLGVILKNVAEGITVQDPKGNLIFANEAAAQILDFPSAKRLLEVSVDEIMKRFSIFTEDGKTMSLINLPSRQALMGKFPKEMVVKFLDRATEEVHWSLVKATPVFNSKDEVQLVINVFRDITDRKLADQKKDEFVAIVGHELKTPLTSVRGFAELGLARAQKIEDEALIEYLTDIVIQTNRSFGLIRDLVELARLQVNRLQLEKEYFLIQPLVAETVRALQATTTHHRIVINGKVKSRLHGDRRRLGQVMGNLLSNAIRYSPPQKPITVSLKLTRDTVTIAFKDEGPGISRSDQKRIFERFYQGSGGDSRRGLGLGLYIAHEIVKKHKGKIWVESKEGHGSTFFVRLPLSK